MASRWVKATLAKDDTAVKNSLAAAGDEVFVNLDLAALIYRSNLGSHI
jgi:hypothetical protein